MKLQYRNPSLSLFVITLYLLIALCLVITTPLTHNPDANFYYGVAYRLSRGDFLSSLDGMYAPLTSWLMAPLLSCGVSAPYAYRCVALFAYLLVLTGVKALGSLLQIPKLFQTLALYLTGLHLLVFTVTTISGDLLSSGIFLWFLYFLLVAEKRPSSTLYFFTGLLGSLAYYAKPILLPVALCTICASCLNALRRGSSSLKTVSKFFLSVATPLVLVSSCWIVLLSSRYQTPIFTAQQLLSRYPNSRYDYTPDTYQAFIGPDRKGPGIPNAHIRNTFESNSERVLFAANYLWSTLSNLFFGIESLTVWIVLLIIGCVFSIILRSHQAFFLVSAATLIHSSAHLYLWGPYLRYYFPIYPLCHMLISVPFFIRDAKVQSPYHRLGMGALALIVVQSSIVTINAVVDEIRSPERIAYSDLKECLARIAEVQGDLPSAVTANSTSQLPGLLAAVAGIELWTPLYPQLAESPKILEERIRRWNVAQIWWHGPPYTSLTSLAGFQKPQTVTCRPGELTIYELAA